MFCSFFLIYSCDYEKQIEKNKHDNKMIVEESENLSKGLLEFEKKIIDKGDVYEGDIVEALYTFTNVGSEPLTIEYVNPDCICTNFKFTKEPIEINQKGFVKLVLDTKNKYGQQKLFATIKTNNVDKFYRIIMKVNVMLPKEKDK